MFTKLRLRYSKIRGRFGDVYVGGKVLLSRVLEKFNVQIYGLLD
jgi:hypothetical protein